VPRTRPRARERDRGSLGASTGRVPTLRWWTGVDPCSGVTCSVTGGAQPEGLGPHGRQDPRSRYERRGQLGTCESGGEPLRVVRLGGRAPPATGCGGWGEAGLGELSGGPAALAGGVVGGGDVPGEGVGGGLGFGDGGESAVVLVECVAQGFD